MRKAVSLLLIAAMAAALFGCSTSKPSTPTGTMPTDESGFEITTERPTAPIKTEYTSVFRQRVRVCLWLLKTFIRQKNCLRICNRRVCI